MAVYYAVASTPLTSEVITISTPSGGFGQGTAVAVSGTNTAAPFDPNANAKKAGTCASNCTGLTSPGLSTTNVDALVLCGIVMSSTVTPTNFGTLTTDHVDYKQFYGHATYASAQTNNVIRAVNQADGNYSYCAAFTPGSVPGVTGGRLLFQ
jgi:multisubunit Na+/H+ antiporter MnhB subunit